mmetsp:Transcript_44320/g.96400  ORF Transcript_44320/g.96400 Transcript_44320/m.96400 type:complete len:507 (-) Transcript_44320:256-1776(-)
MQTTGSIDPEQLYPSRPAARSFDEMFDQLRHHVWQNRIRMRDMFQDFDPLRGGRVTAAQFRRVLDLARVPLTQEEKENVAAAFEVGDRKEVHYFGFCDRVDEVFTQKNLEKTPTRPVGEPGSMVKKSRSTGSIGFGQNRLTELLHRLASLTKTRGVVFKYCYQDFDPLKAGRCNYNNFKRFFPFKERFSQEDILVLAKAYHDGGTKEQDHFVNYLKLHNDVTSPNSFASGSPIARSTFVPRPEMVQWSLEDSTPEQRLQAQVVMHRLRLPELFQDFDALRKGYCTIRQVQTVCAILGVTISQQDFDHFIQKYTREDGMFCYAELCAEVERAFTDVGLEKTPLKRIHMPDSATTVPARRSYQRMTNFEAEEIARIEASVRDRVQQQRIDLLHRFQDFDPIRTGHVTKAQAARVFTTLGFDLTEAELELLGKKYFDLGNRKDFNYLECVAACDPPDDILMAKKQMIVARSPSLPHLSRSSYFTAMGDIIPRGRMNTIKAPLISSYQIR